MSLSVVEPEQPSGRTEEFSRAYGAGDEVAAVKIAIEALESRSSFVPPFESLWWLCGELLARRRYGLGLDLTERVWKRGYRGWRAMYLRGVFLALNRDIEAAAETLASARELAPADKKREISLLEARLRALLGQDNAALKLFTENLKFDRESARYIDAALRVAQRSEKKALIARWLTKANSALGPSIARMALLAKLHYERGEWTEAHKAATAGIRLAPEDKRFGRIAARSAYRGARLVQAISQLEQQVARDAEWTEGKILLSRGLLAGGRESEARRVLRSIEPGTKYEEERREMLTRLGERTEDDVPVDAQATGKATGAETKHRRKKTNPLDDPEVKKIMSDIPADFAPCWTPATLAERGNLFVAIGRLFHSVRTLMLRETMARFGRHELGYLWAVIEPMIHVMVFSFVFSYIRMRDSLGMNVILFVTTGVVPLFFYLKTYNHLTNALKQNRPLLNHSSVQPMDIFFARSILEFFTQMFVLILFVSFIYVFVEKYAFGDALSVLANVFGLWMVGVGMGLAMGSLTTLAESLKNVMDGFNRIIYLTSGVFFTLDMMPASVAKYASYNPLLHFVDGVRGNFSPLMGGSRVDITYGYSWAVGIFVFGLVADRALRRRVLDR